MFGSFLCSFNEKISFGTPSEGAGAGGGSGASDDPGFLGIILLPSDDLGDGLGGNVNTTLPVPKQTVEIIDVNYVETAIISGSGAPGISGPVTQVIAEEYIIEHGAELEAAFAAQGELVTSSGLGELSATELAAEIRFINMYRNSPATGYHSVHPDTWSITDEHIQARNLVEQGYSIAKPQMIANGTTADEFVFTDEAGNYVEANVINNDDVIVSSGLDVNNGLQIIHAESDLLPSYAAAYTNPDDQPENPEEAWDNLVSAGGITTMWNPTIKSFTLIDEIVDAVDVASSYRGFMAAIDAIAAAERIEHWDDLYTEENGALVPNDATINNDAWMLENLPAAFQAQTLWSADLLGSTVHEWIVDGTIESAEEFVSTARDFISGTYENIAEWIF